MHDSKASCEPCSETESLLARSLVVFAEYDEARLRAYRPVGAPERIGVERWGSSTAMRFTEVGYFNRVYGVDASTVTGLASLLDFYSGCDHPIQLVAAPGVDLNDFAVPLQRAGFEPGPAYARVAQELAKASRFEPGHGVRLLERDEFDDETFLDLYLHGFGAAPDRHAAAKRNMRQLFDVDELHFFMATHAGTPAGIGMLYLSGSEAFLCAGATLPEFEQRGCHTALIQHRLMRAAELGAQRAVSWAYDGGSSHRNMAAQGFATIGIDRAWERP